MIKVFIITLVVTIATGCTPAKISSQKLPAEVPRAKVVVYREYAFQYSAVPVVVGSNSIDKVKIYNKEHAEFYLPIGNQAIFVRTTQADRPYILKVDLAHNEVLCLVTKAKPDFYVKMLIPMSSFLTSAFTIQKASCSDAAFRPAA